jgi:hypothetical protein
MSARDGATRREFLGIAGSLAATAGAGPPPLPKVKFGQVEITRLIIGSNPLYGYSHFNRILDNLMREWMTQDRRIEVLHRAEQCGINTWQVHYNDPTIEDLKRYRAEGGKMHWLLLADFELMKNWKLLPEVARLNPIGIAHHGNRTDERFRAGQMSIVRDFVNAVHDAGVPAGVSTHNPAVVEYIEEHGWNVDYYMTCMYRVTRTPEEARKEFGEAPVGEIYMERDPERMCAVVRKTRKTCFAFKVLGAGRNINTPERLEAAFRFVLTNIKPQDAIIVGMFPRFKDEIRENVEIVSRILARGSAAT